MADDHFSRETVLSFLQSELSKDENRNFVRHLLRQCPECSRLIQEVSQRQDFRFLIRDLEDLICDELNVKSLRFVEREEDLVEVTAKANFRVCGPRFGTEILQTDIKLRFRVDPGANGVVPVSFPVRFVNKDG